MVGKFIKAFCGAGPDASWGMFSSKNLLPERHKRKKNKLREAAARVKSLFTNYHVISAPGGETKS